MIKKLSVVVALLSLPLVVTLYGACAEEDTFRSRPIAGACNYERGDGRCNNDGDCCPGKECSAFGFCKAC